MPLPLPNLDTRRWADLVEEGRALIPRYAPQWSDHNIHDPGITLIELFAWLIEADIYRTNRVPPRHRRKYLQLTGFAPRPPQPAGTVLRFVMKPGYEPALLPAGLTLVAGQGGSQIPFRLLDDLWVVDTEIAAVQSCGRPVDRSADDGKVYTDHTRAQKGHFCFLPWGADPGVPVSADPEEQPALYLGLTKALPIGRAVDLWFRFAGPASDREERRRLLEEVGASRVACPSLYPTPRCPPMEVPDTWCPPEPGAGLHSHETTAPATLLHHSIRTAWDYWDGGTWRPLDGTQDEVIDDTRGFTLDGSVRITLPTPMAPERFGVVKDPLHYLRARLVAGPPDYLPTVLNIEINAVAVEQASSVLGNFVIRPGVSPAPGPEPQAGELGHLGIELDQEGAITWLAFAPVGDGPEVRVVAYVPAQPSVPGALTMTLVLVGRGTGLPGLKVVLPGAPVAPDSTRVWTLSGGGWEEWGRRPDLDASGRTDAHYVLAATTGEITFGDGERGRVVPPEAAVLACFDTTSAANGNVPAGVGWRLKNAGDGLNLALLGKEPNGVAEAFGAIENPLPATGGADEEDLEHAAGRAAEVVWVHERLLDLCTASASKRTLDGLDRDLVLARAAPKRAITLIDYERLALDVPGAPVARARAWAGIDPGLPCFKAPGTVVVILVPWLPAKQPTASPALLDAVQRFLDRRRLVGTRLVVVGPRYRKVTVHATLAVRPGTRAGRVIEDVRKALDSFLDPLSGGPERRGWPFGRDLYRSEVLEVIDQVAGVDHVKDLQLIGDGQPPQCGNLCVGPLMLVAPGTHVLTVAENLVSKGGAHACIRG